MTKTLHGRVHGKTIELDEDPGVADGQAVEVQMKTVEPLQPKPTNLGAGLAEIYAILGERYRSGHADTAERHNEHQP